MVKSHFKGKDSFIRLAWPHYGSPRNDEEKVIKPQHQTKVYHADDNGKVKEVDSNTKDQRTGYRQRIGCTYQFRLKPVAPASIQWCVEPINGEHNHPIAQHVSKYPMNRSLEGTTLDTVISMIKAQAESKTIMQFLEGHGIEL